LNALSSGTQSDAPFAIESPIAMPNRGPPVILSKKLVCMKKYTYVHAMQHAQPIALALEADVVRGHKRKIRFAKQILLRTNPTQPYA